jgi:hypothetical protein
VLKLWSVDDAELPESDQWCLELCPVGDAQLTCVESGRSVVFGTVILRRKSC